MTREDAIKGLKRLAYEFSGYKPNEEMFEMAIKALEQNPCEDAISRQAVFEAMRKNHRNGGRDIDGDFIEGNYSEHLYEDIKSLPSVIPQRKIGECIGHKEYNGGRNDAYRH